MGHSKSVSEVKNSGTEKFLKRTNKQLCIYPCTAQCKNNNNAMGLDNDGIPMSSDILQPKIACSMKIEH